MQGDCLKILRGPDIAELLQGRETELLRIVERVYKAHAAGNQSSVPHSVFLRFPGDEVNRIIALPAWLGDGFGIAGVKWIASFPGNTGQGLDRASGALILSSASTGRPTAILEGSVISAKRTAASAALAALHLSSNRQAGRVGLIGCGVINYEIARFLAASFAGLRSLAVADTDSARASQFRMRVEKDLQIEVEISRTDSLLRNCDFISLATNATVPHIPDLSMCLPEAVILHVSLRDIAPAAILAVSNFVDDVDHVCRALTSVHLAEQLSGSRRFIQGTLGDLLLGKARVEHGTGRVKVFSPFGLGILDLAVGQFACTLGVEQNRAIEITSFLPEPWAQATEAPAHRSNR